MGYFTGGSAAGNVWNTYTFGGGLPLGMYGWWVFVENPPVRPPPCVTECLAPESKNIPTLDQTNLARLQPMLLGNAR